MGKREIVDPGAKQRGFFNNNERRIWVLNDEGLYSWFRASRQSMTSFLRENRHELDTCISRVLDVRPIG